MLPGEVWGQYGGFSGGKSTLSMQQAGGVAKRTVLKNHKKQNVKDLLKKQCNSCGIVY